MANYYVKLFQSILDSSIWRRGSSDTRVVWITMMAMADRDGVVDNNVFGIADRAKVSEQACQHALDVFLAPDPQSRTEDQDGRKVEKVPGGYKLINYEYYRDLASLEQKREQAASRQRRKRLRDDKLKRAERD